MSGPTSFPVAAQVSIERATEITESAFLPLRCVVEFSEFEDSFNYAVYLSAEDRIVYKENATLIKNAPRLKVSLEVARKQVASRGAVLDPWVFPDA